MIEIVLEGLQTVLMLVVLVAAGKALRQPPTVIVNDARLPQPVPSPEPAPLSATKFPVELRPDPSAKFNVFRIDEGRLIVDDVRYSGNDEALAKQSFETYQSQVWRGEVYFFQHTQCIEVLR